MCALCFAPAAPVAGDGQRQLYWGDTHVHTSWSIDAFATGNHLAGPDEAYRFAKGEPVLHPRLRHRIRIDRPLDFLVVADHAEHLRWQVATLEANPLLKDVPGYAAAQALVRDEPRRSFWLGPVPLAEEFYAAVLSPQFRADAWQRQVALAEAHNDPGRFTTLSGWEWSSRGGGSNLHRVVFSPSGDEALKRFIPYSNRESEDPEDLWAWLEATAQATGAQFIAIPHNSNLSAGYMFADTAFDGRPIDAGYARTRMRWEPVMEVAQVKGTSETHPALSPNDEFADFEIFEKLLGPGEFRPLRADYARSALLQGLAIAAATGENPYAFGLIGSTDSHTGLSSVAEDDFQGKLLLDSLPAERLDSEGVFFPAWEMSAAGLAGVWAAENTRDAIFDAFRRREVYATSGPRIRLRLQAGFGDGAGDGAVPMGDELAAAPGGQSPTLWIEAMQDPEGAALQRVQVVKGWLDAKGGMHEQVFDAARDDGDGASQLSVAWTDPDFDPQRHAFWYVRVLQVPTPRHSTHDALALGLDPERTGRPVTIQERAWSSPVWYSPGP